MRSDYALYVVAIICFIITVYSYVSPPAGVTELYLYALVVIGLIFVGLGYMARPKVGSLTSTVQTKPAKQSNKEPIAEKDVKTEVPKKTPKKRTRKRRATKKRTKTS